MAWLVLVPSTAEATTLEAFGRAAKAAAQDRGRLDRQLRPDRQMVRGFASRIAHMDPGGMDRAAAIDDDPI